MILIKQKHCILMWTYTAFPLRAAKECYSTNVFIFCSSCSRWSVEVHRHYLLISSIITFFHDLSIAAFVLNHPLIASAVFGATKPWQLAEILEASNVHLSAEIMSEINEVHTRFPNPCPWLASSHGVCRNHWILIARKHVFIGLYIIQCAR